MLGVGFIKVPTIDLLRSLRIMSGVLIVRKLRLQIMIRFSGKKKNLLTMKTTFKRQSRRKDQNKKKNRGEVKRVSHNLNNSQKEREVRGRK